MWLLLLLVLTVLFIIVATAKLRLHPFLALMIAAFGYGLLCGHLTLVEVVETVNTGFGGTIGYIGIVIIAGSIIGVFLEKSGGAYRLAERTIQFTGKRNVPLAMSVVGYIVSIPVFCDSGFVILSPLNRGLSRKAKTSLAGGAVALALGLYATHTMVPPTPGPMAAAALLRADLGLVILWGLLVSLVALAAGLVFAVGFASRTVVHDRLETEEIPEEPGDTPSAGKSILPILIPILLIVLRSVSELPSRPFGGGGTVAVIQFIGHPGLLVASETEPGHVVYRRLGREGGDHGVHYHRDHRCRGGVRQDPSGVRHRCCCQGSAGWCPRGDLATFSYCRRIEDGAGVFNCCDYDNGGDYGASG